MVDRGVVRFARVMIAVEFVQIAEHKVRDIIRQIAIRDARFVGDELLGVEFGEKHRDVALPHHFGQLATSIEVFRIGK